VTDLVRALVKEFGPDELAELAERLRPYMVGEDGWLGTREAAAYAGCTVPALRYAMSRGDVEFEQRVAGGKTYFRRSALDTWRSNRATGD
jgi:hypothetical protein